MLAPTSEAAEESTAISSPARVAPRLPAVMTFSRLRRMLVERRAMIGTVAASFAVFGLMAVQGILLARLLGPTARGAYASVVLYAQTLLYVGMLGAPLTLARRAAVGPTQWQPLLNAAARYGAWTGVATAVIVALLGIVALPADRRHLAVWCALAAWMVPAEHVRLGLLAVEHGRGAFGRYNACRIAAAAMFPGLLAACWIGGATSLGAIVACTVFAPIAGLLMYLRLEPRTRPWGEVAVAPTQLAREGVPYAAENLVGSISGRLDMLLVLWLVSDLALQGEYAAAIPAANLLIVAPGALELFAFNAGARHPDGLGFRRWAPASLGVGALQLASWAALAAIIEPLVVFVYGQEFRGTVAFAKALLPGFALAGAAGIAEAYLRGRGRPHVSLRIHLATMAVVVVTVSATWGTWSAMSIPLGLAVGRLTGLVLLLAAIAADRSRPAAVDVAGGAHP